MNINPRFDLPVRKTMLWLAVAAGAALRFTALGSKPLWVDELATLQRLSLGFVQHLQSMRGNHPLYELLLRFWMPPDGSDAWMRIPSAALGTLAIWLTWLVARRAGKWTGVAAAWLMALSPLHVMYSRIARAYGLSCTLVLLSTLAFLWALRRRGVVPWLVYVVTSAAMIYSNLVAGTICIAQGLFVLWFYRRRWRRIFYWALAGVGISVLLAPWIVYSMPGAVEWSVETQYTARQFGLLAKAFYLPLTFCLGETVHPLNLWVVIPAFVGFGIAIVTAVLMTLRRRKPILLLALLAVMVPYGMGLFFDATASKHLLILLPFWFILAAAGAGWWLRPPRIWQMGAGILALMIGTMTASDANYFGNRQFADADMVTPWRQIADTIEQSAEPNEIIVIGYRPDPGAFDMFNRYYTGNLPVRWLKFDDWRGDIAGALEQHGSVWLLLHDGDPWEDAEVWFNDIRTPYTMVPFQEEEHTLRGLREGWRNAGKYRSPLYRLYHVRLPG